MATSDGGMADWGAWVNEEYGAGCMRMVNGEVTYSTIQEARLPSNTSKPCRFFLTSPYLCAEYRQLSRQ